MVPLRVVIASTIGATAILVLLLILVIILLKRREETKLTDEEIDEFLLGVSAEQANAKLINGPFVLPYDPRLEIPKAGVLFRSKVLGSGAFGQVVLGTYEGKPVAIKMLQNNASQNADSLRSLLGELKVLSYLGTHPNVVGLVGAITRDINKGEACLIFEYCYSGNAHEFLRDRRDNFVDMFAGQTSSNISGMKRTSGLSRMGKYYGTTRLGKWLTTNYLVRWSCEVASAMEYVASKNVYHGDLAARNILLTEDSTPKIGDFGLSKQVGGEANRCYIQKEETPLPVEWMAIESLRDLKFSIQSDVWSFGVAMWELFTLGTDPYPGIEWNFESWKLLRDGKRLDKPEYASNGIYDIMTICWDADPKARPSFAQLKDALYTELRKL